jgi:hypothetical protein
MISFFSNVYRIITKTSSKLLSKLGALGQEAFILLRRWFDVSFLLCERVTRRNARDLQYIFQRIVANQ